MASGASGRPNKGAGARRGHAGRRLRSSNDPSALALMPPPGIDPPVHEAITDLYAYVLVLDAELQRLSAQAHRLAESGGEPARQAELDDHRAEITRELEALRAMIVALQQGHP